MSAAAVESGRARPLSGGLWTLFSWLRRDEHASSDSLSSGGSDRTAASFAFLAPAHCATHPAPRALPPPPPPTDSYKKRVRDRNLRRHHDRDITLLRKYGLHGFEAFSLPNARRAAGERDRRATSELVQPRAHVPGKRRAPLPPSDPSSLTRPRARKRPAPQPPIQQPSVQKLQENNIDTHPLSNSATLPMNFQRVSDKTSSKQNEVAMGCRSEKYSKKEKQQESTSKDVKPRQDKSFLKQIFENRKRNSAIETSSVKLLPSISELDKQAHEIIERYKLKELEQNTQQGSLDNETPGSSNQVEAWICTRCLRKYNATVITCLYCLPLEDALLNNSCKSSKVSNHGTQTNNSPRSGIEDKEKLKEILKEMKHNLSKTPAVGLSKSINNSSSETEPGLSKSRNISSSETEPGLSKSRNNSSSETEPKGGHLRVVEAATLRIGSSVSTEARSNPANEPVSPDRKPKLDKQKSSSYISDNFATIENVLITQPEVLVHTKDNIVVVDKNEASKIEESQVPKQPSGIVNRKNDKPNITKTEIASKILNAENTGPNIGCSSKPDINTPLKISSLFNPIYIPKKTTTTTAQMELKRVAKPETAVNTTKESVIPSSSHRVPSISNLLSVDLTKEPEKENERKQQTPRENIVITKKNVESPIAKNPERLPAMTQSTTQEHIVNKLDQHSRRRNLINQLEQSIAKGDERAAAEAAVKLAQLRLSCSVLSFSSQIVAEASTSSPETSSQKANHSKTEEVSNVEVLQARTANATTATTTISDSTVKVSTDAASKSKFSENNNAAVEKQEINNQIKSSAFANSEAVSKTETVINNRSQKKDAPVQNTTRYAPSTSKHTNDLKINTNEDVPILVWVEDKEATRGPVQIHVRRNATLGELRRQAEASLGLAVRMQRWIVGRALCSDDAAPLVTLAGPALSAPFYLCLVEYETKDPIKPDEANKSNEEGGNFYDDLVKLEQQAIVSNAEAFECGVCMEECPPGRGVVLRECVHSFCNACLSDVVRHSEEPVVSCPATGCRGVLQEREIKGLVTADDYEKWLARGLAVAESGTRNAFHCRTRDCTGWALCEPGVRRFPCPVCKRTNCVPCQVIHEGETCEQNRERLEVAAAANDATNETDEGTRALLDALIARGEALECPECCAIITKKWGCDWIKCSACKTEICWVTRGRRWGPAGRGDTSAGCRCGTDGKKCHPSCGYCH